MAPILPLPGDAIAELDIDSDWWPCKHSFFNKIILFILTSGFILIDNHI